MPKPYEGTGIDLEKMWDYVKHADNTFGDRQNFFLLFQSILIGGVIVGKGRSSKAAQDLQSALPILGLLGLVITLIWWYVQFRQAYVLDCVIDYIRLCIPTYREVIRPIRDAPFRRNSTMLQGYYIPFMVAVLWLVMLAVL